MPSHVNRITTPLPTHRHRNILRNPLQKTTRLPRLKQSLNHLQIPERLARRLLRVRLDLALRDRPCKLRHFGLDARVVVRVLVLRLDLLPGRRVFRHRLDASRVPDHGALGRDDFDLKPGLELGAERDGDGAGPAGLGDGHRVHRVDGREALLEQVHEGGDARDSVIGPGGTEEQPQGGDKVHATVEEEAALVVGDFAPCMRGQIPV